MTQQVPINGANAIVLPLTSADVQVFGDGNLGDVTVTSDDFAFAGGDYENFTLAAGVTVKPPMGQAVIIRATGKITILGTIDSSGALPPFNIGSAGVLMLGDQVGAQGGGGGGGNGAGSQGAQQFGGGGGGGPVIGYAIGVQSNPGSPGLNNGGAGGNATPGVPGGPSAALLAQLRLPGGYTTIPTGGAFGASGNQGGQGGQAGPSFQNGGSGGQGGQGGSAGSAIMLIAPNVEFGSASNLIAKGLAGTNGQQGQPGQNGINPNDGGSGGGGGGGGGQGGGGGFVIVKYNTLTGVATIQITGGPGSSGGPGGAGGLGNPAGLALNGGVGGNGANGCVGSVGFVFMQSLASTP